MQGFGGLKYGSAVFIGDSICLGERTGVTAPQAAAAIIADTKKLIPYTNSGVSGNTSVDVLTRFEKDCLSYGPSMVSIGNLGTNDPGGAVPVGSVGTAGSYTDNIAQMIVKAQRIGARVTLWVPILAQNSTLDSSIAPYRTAIRSLASTYSCDLFDTYDDMAALDATTQNSYFLEAAGSGQHLSAAGNAWIAGLVGSGSYANSFVSSAR